MNVNRWGGKLWKFSASAFLVWFNVYTKNRKDAELEVSYSTASEEAQYLAYMRDLWESDRATDLRYAR